MAAARMRTARCLLRELNVPRASRIQLQRIQCSRYSTNNEEKKPTLRDQMQDGPRPFQAQLWDSTYQRIQREREQKLKYGAMQRFGDNATNRTVTVLMRMYTSKTVVLDD
jgi:hypothetical protein